MLLRITRVMKFLVLLRVVVFVLVSVSLASCAKAPNVPQSHNDLYNECMEDDQPHKGLGIPLGLSSGRFYKLNREKILIMNEYHPYAEAYAEMRVAPEKDLDGLASFVFALDKDTYRLCSVSIEGIDQASIKNPMYPPFPKKMTAEMKSKWVTYLKSKLGEPLYDKNSLKWQKEGTRLVVTGDNLIYLEDQAVTAIQEKIRANPIQCY